MAVEDGGASNQHAGCDWRRELRHFRRLAPGEASPMRVAAKSDAVLEQVVGRLSLEPTVSAASWSVEALAE